MQLSNENIRKTCSDVDKILLDYSDDSKWRLRITLIIEEILLQYQEIYGENIEFSFQKDKRWGQTILNVKIKSESLDPFENTEDNLLENLLQNLGFTPNWRYRRGINELSFRIEKRSNPLEILSYLLAAVLGIAIGKLASLLPDRGVFIDETFLAPLFDKVIGGLVAFTVVYIFISVVNGILGMGNTNTLKTTGAKVIGTIFSSTAGIIVVSLLTLIPFFTITTGSNTQISLTPIYDMLINIIATDVVTPFQTGNVLQIFYLAICVGLALLFFREHSSGICSLFQQAAAPVGIIVTTISKLMPIAIFISMFEIMISDSVSQIVSYSKYLFLVIFISLVNAAVSLCIISIREKVSPMILLKKLIPVVSLAFMTASSMVCFISKCEIGEKKLGIDKSLIDVAVPMTQVIYPVSFVLTLLPMGMFCSELYGLPITPVSILVMAIVTWLLSLSSPSIPGGGTVTFTLFLMQMGVPIDALAIILALDVILDHVVTATGQFFSMTVLIHIAEKTGKLDKEILRT